MVKRVQIKAARIMIGWSQDRLASEAGLTRQTILALETGRTKVSKESREAVLKVLDEYGITFYNQTGIMSVELNEEDD